MALAGGWRGILTSRLGVDNLFTRLLLPNKYDMCYAGLNSKWWALRKTLEMPAQHSFESWKIINLKLRLLCVTFLHDTWRSYVYHMTIWVEPSRLLLLFNTMSFKHKQLLMLSSHNQDTTKCIILCLSTTPPPTRAQLSSLQYRVWCKSSDSEPLSLHSFLLPTVMACNRIEFLSRVTNLKFTANSNWRWSHVSDFECML